MRASPGPTCRPPFRNENRVRAAAIPPRAVGTPAEGARSASTATGKWDRCRDSDTRAPSSKGIYRPARAQTGTGASDAEMLVAALGLNRTTFFGIDPLNSEACTWCGDDV